MNTPVAPKKIVILGGGISGLTTAFELTSQPGWEKKYDITLYQMGWRVGGKCATARGPNNRIEEHGIHGFLGCYYNALPLMSQCYKALGRKPGEPLATFEEAFHPDSFMLMWEFAGGGLKRWPFTAPTNERLPDDPSSLQTIRQWIVAVIGFVESVLEPEGVSALSPTGLALGAGRLLLRDLQEHIADAQRDILHALPLLDDVAKWLASKFMDLIESNDDLRRLFIIADYLITLVRGTIADNILEKGFDSIDGENFSDWLLRHGASVLTVSSPMALNTVNLSYQYPQGDTARTASMAAGAYLHWTLRSYAYMGAFAWLFEAGTGETVIAPLYIVLQRRGVKFEFFHKVSLLELAADQQSISTIHLGVQATLKNPALGYDALKPVDGLPSWPAGPRYEQLVEGDALRAQDIDLESYWTPWQPVASKTLQAGQDYDQIVFAISIGAIPYLCKDILAVRQDWQTMVAKVTTVQTQTMQLWLNRSTPELGWDIPFKNPTDTVIGATYLNPLDGQVDFTHLLQWESWPATATPKALWYFSGAMAQYEVPPPLTDTDYPRRAHERVKAQCIQYLQAGIGPLLPQATTNAISPPGDPMGLDFSLLQSYDEATAGQGVKRFDQQFWRANIDPSELYVTSPPGSTAARLKAWGSGLANLVLCGDWIYTGLNVGSVEGAVMGGRLASHAVSGLPLLADITGYPAANGSVIN
ncbi:MAG: NAD(P)-binding protein [Bdellovibrionales bacterium]|nr:NAD(P)-binding protein [Ramlibacter sp.]